MSWPLSESKYDKYNATKHYNKQWSINNRSTLFFASPLEAVDADKATQMASSTAIKDNKYI